MNIEFTAILVIVTLLSGALALASIGLSRRLVARGTGGGLAQAAAAGRRLNPLFEYARSLFPLVLVVLLIRSFVFEPFRIPSASMMPGLVDGDFIIVTKYAYGLRLPLLHTRLLPIGEPRRGDVVVFRLPADPSVHLIKRLVGLPGDQISIQSGHVIRDGVREKDSYIAPCNGSGSCDFPNTVTVPKGDYFMMGDNRGESDDSRFWGPVPKSWIIGQAFFTYWPPGRFGTL